MSKPIAIIYLPIGISVSGRDIGWSDCGDMQKGLDASKPDYHWFVLLDDESKRMEFKVFYEKDFTEIQYEELKQLIEQSIEKFKELSK